MQHLFFIGMPGSGKSFWAKELSNILGWNHFDTDEMIIAKTNKQIVAIFEEEGEVFFRKMETLTLQTIIESNENFVCSTGGGLPINHDNFLLMKQKGTTIYLQSSIPFLLKNINNEKENRPLLQVNDIEQKLKELYNERKYVYEQADYSFNAEQLILSQLLSIIQR